MFADDRGSILPLILGFLTIGLLAIAAGVAAGDAFVQQRELQSICDGAAAAAAAEAVALDRDTGLAADGFARFAAVRDAVARYLDRDTARRGVQVDPVLSSDRATISLTCVQSRSPTFGAAFGAATVRHVAHASAKAALS